MPAGLRQVRDDRAASRSKHTVFGKVIEGHDVVDAIQKGDALEAVTVRG